jgi:hypothetical protein
LEDATTGIKPTAPADVNDGGNQLAADFNDTGSAY